MAARVAFLLLGSLALAAGQATDKTVIGIIGDWGFGPDSSAMTTADLTDYPGRLFPYQQAVAKGLGDTCQSRGCHIVLGAGDNFYEAGTSVLTGAEDPQFQTSFQQVYNHPYLQNLTFWHCLGNHDYGYSAISNNITYPGTSVVVGNYSIWPQVEYTYKDTTGRWKMPGRFYNKIFNNVPVPFGLTVMDSSPYLFQYCCDSTSSVKNFTSYGATNYAGDAPLCTKDPKYNTTELLYACQNTQRDAQAAWAGRSIKSHNDLGLWKIFMGHHPMINIGDGLQSPWSFFLQSIFNQAGSRPHFAVNGHEHVLAVNTNNIVNETVFTTVGSSGNVQKSLNDANTGAWATSGLYQPSPKPSNGATYNAGGIWKAQYAYSGFGILTLNTTHGTIDIYGILSPNISSNPSLTFPILYSYTFTKAQMNP